MSSRDFCKDAPSRGGWQTAISAESGERGDRMITSAPLLSPTAIPPQAGAPDGLTLYAIGDVHGRADLLKLMIEQIRSDNTGSQDRTELIFLGDYIDRGPASYAVIDQILDLQGDPNFLVTALKGNHESMALHFLR